MSRKAQAWYLDLVAGMFIFIAGLIVYYYANTNLSYDDKEIYDDISRDAESIASLLLTPGYPLDWDSETVEQIGVVTGQELDEGKWLQFSAIPYNESRRLLGTQNEFFAFLAEKNESIINITSLCGIGDPSVIAGKDSDGNCLPISLEEVRFADLAKKERYILHNGRVAKAVVYLWR